MFSRLHLTTSERIVRKLSRHGRGVSIPSFTCSFRRWTTGMGKSNLISECYKVSFPILRGHGWFKIRRKGVLTSSNGSLYRLAFAPRPIPLHPDLLVVRSYELQRAPVHSRAPGTEFNIQAPEPRKSKRDYRRNETLSLTVRCTSLFRWDYKIFRIVLFALTDLFVS